MLHLGPQDEKTKNKKQRQQQKRKLLTWRNFLKSWLRKLRVQDWLLDDTITKLHHITWAGVKDFGYKNFNFNLICITNSDKCYVLCSCTSLDVWGPVLRFFYSIVGLCLVWYFNGDSVIFWFDLFIVNYALGFTMCEGDISSTQRFEAIRFDLVWFGLISGLCC